MTGFLLLNDPASHHQLLIRGDHVTAAEIRRHEGTVVLHMLGGMEIALTREESRQFLHHAHPHHTEQRTPARATR